jgi:hypothetical protein
LGVGRWELTADSKYMARPFEQITSDRLQIRESGGCLSAFGLPFFAAGVLVVLSVAGVMPISNASDVPVSHLQTLNAPSASRQSSSRCQAPRLSQPIREAVTREPDGLRIDIPFHACR